MRTPVEQIKDRLSIVEVVAPYVRLTRAGKNFKGLSPFTNEKTPSFYVSPERGAYFCFSSGKGGDHFTFIQEVEGVDFRGALKILAERAGVELEAVSPKDRTQRDRLYSMLDDATRWFSEYLRQRTDVREYLHSRGITDTTITRFMLGYAPLSWEHVSIHLREKGYTEQELEMGGITKRGSAKKQYERFRGRIMFPISDAVGRVVGFSGRLFEKDTKEVDAAKYLNSPETPLYEKSRILYGYDMARAAMRKYDFAILVEGQIDLVLSHQVGFQNTVAVSGTGLTKEHLSLIARMTNNVVMAFDADAAGLRSGSRGARLALSLGMHIKIAALPDGVDPADLVLANPDSWRAAVRGATPVVEFYLAHATKEGKTGRVALTLIRDMVLPLVASIQSPIERAQAVGYIAERLSVPVNAVEGELAHQNRNVHTSSPSVSIMSKRGDERQQDEQPRLSRFERLVQTIAGMIWLARNGNAPFSEAELIARLSGDVTPEEIASYTERWQHEQTRILFELDLILEDASHHAHAFEELIKEFQQEYRRAEIVRLQEQVRLLESSGDEDTTRSLLARLNELARKVQQ